jgi:hypothetical protein
VNTPRLGRVVADKTLIASEWLYQPESNALEEPLRDYASQFRLDQRNNYVGRRSSWAGQLMGIDSRHYAMPKPGAASSHLSENLTDSGFEF